MDIDSPQPSMGDIHPDRAAIFDQQLEHKRRAGKISVPTDDGQVRAQLRELEEPITLFGEGKAERRDRLRELLTVREEDADADDGLESGSDIDIPDAQDEEEAKAEEEFYTEGTDALLKSRQDIAFYSLPRAQRRIQFQKAETTISLKSHVKSRNETKARLKEIELVGSHVAAERPVSISKFAPNGEMVAAGTWGGVVKILNVPDLAEKRVLRGHTDRVGGIAWYPDATKPGSGVSPDSVNLATSGGEGSINLWSLNSDTPLSTLTGHSDRVARINFHPSGKYLASASYDTTWRLWDVATSTELLLEEGHSREVYNVAFNEDGSLLASAGLDSIGRIWDLRTGRTIMILEGHTREIYGLDWSSTGHQLLTGSIDGMAMFWDVRKVSEAAKIPANTRGVTDLKFFRGTDGPLSSPDKKLPAKEANGDYLPKKSGTWFVSCGFDKNVNVFSANDWVLVKALGGHSGNVLSCDITDDGKWIVSSGHDRTVKIWGRDDASAL